MRRILSLLVILAVLAGAYAIERWANADEPGTPGNPVTARFTLCHEGGGRNCVVDGDTFWIEGEKVRIRSIDAPETHPPRCTREANTGIAATNRLHALLNAGPVVLTRHGDDPNGRTLADVEVAGPGGKRVDVGEQLIAEELAIPYPRKGRKWCP